MVCCKCKVSVGCLSMRYLIPHSYASFFRSYILDSSIYTSYHVRLCAINSFKFKFKIMKQILALLLGLFVITTVQAQLGKLKDLKKKVEKSATDAGELKGEKKATKTEEITPEKTETPATKTTSETKSPASTNGSSSNGNSRSRESKMAAANAAPTSDASDPGKYIYDQWKQYSKIYESQETMRQSSRSSSTPIPVPGKQYLEVATAFPMQKVKEVLANKDQFKSGAVTYAKWMTDGLADYENYIVNSGILTHANELAGLSYEAMKQKNEVKATELAENAQGYCKGVLVLSPNNEKAKQILAFADKAYNNATASLAKASGSPLHAKNVNKIVWSTKKLLAGPQSETDIASSFRAGETIYGTAFLSAKLIDRMREDGTKLYLEIKMDGKKIHYYEPYIGVTPEMKQKAYVQFAVVPAITDDLSQEVKDYNKTLLEFNQTMAGKGPLSYKITMSFEFGKTDEKVEGSFDYDISGGTTQNEKLVSKLSDLLAAGVVLPPAAMKNAAMETKMTAGANQYATKGEKYANCRILTANWKVNKNNLGIITDRTIMAAFVATYPDGHCELVRKIFIQDYAGGGSYSSGL